MEGDAYWSSALFSPSKARQQQAQAKDWNYVDSWSARKYAPSSVPAFERNEETLEALSSLAAANERADEERELADRVEEAASKGLIHKLEVDQNTDVYNMLESHMGSEGQDDSAALSSATVILNSRDAKPESIAHRIIDMTDDQFGSSQQLKRTEELRQTLEQEQRRLSALLKEVRSDVWKAAPNLPEKTAEWTRATKLSKAKSAEYNDRSNAGGKSPVPRPTMQDVDEQEREVQHLKSQSRDSEERVSAYGGLPSDGDSAKSKVESARRELRELVMRRDRSFEELVERKR